jgi:hypothetical protein
MLATIERSRIDPHRLYGLIVSESDFLIAVQREIDFQFDGFVFIRKRDVTLRLEGTESKRYQTSIMRKEGYWKTPPKWVQKLPIDSWEKLMLALVDQPAMIENEQQGDAWVGVIKGCTKSTASIHCFSPTGVFEESVSPVPLRSITSLQFGDRYTSTHFKYLGAGPSQGPRSSRAN